MFVREIHKKTLTVKNCERLNTTLCKIGPQYDQMGDNFPEKVDISTFVCLSLRRHVVGLLIVIIKEFSYSFSYKTEHVFIDPQNNHCKVVINFS